MYAATTISRHIVDYCSRTNQPISNLKLQKVLYFLWIDYYKQTGKYLFNDVFSAWQFGPVIPEVYYEFCAYGGMPIDCLYDPQQIDQEDQEIISSILKKYLPITVSKLVNLTHLPNHPWDDIFNTKHSPRGTIPFDLIIRKECIV
ncbi:Panacea domain-containing protein [Butyricicoccus pullicaecorum]|uniref:Antitoxin SocA-like Panacea domain-containing protein n=1 Tax=Butyricicoccus pullicaecorum 1.2 TaxID=1203606 RepID=R8W4K9_9FIRM|nr:type II toxin-antitoxin system antitoxin SocA domain-containing protein [Butyricicoccus pullicaecorum]EOQ39654.1 hypothetical protein HMPREF1526_00348 [Butyricicoccus pullicaecorum 1.2]SKA56913.1 Uncharacterized phage-associated protein [Butyricicoccus pullicaecorum DSM 23266]